MIYIYIYIYVYIYIYIYIYIGYLCIYIYIYIYIHYEDSYLAGGGIFLEGGTSRDGLPDLAPARRSRSCRTVSFHNFKSQNFKLSVSNPKSKYVVYLSALSQISNCQSLGRKNKHEILKTDRIVSCYVTV